MVWVSLGLEVLLEFRDLMDYQEELAEVDPREMMALLALLVFEVIRFVISF